MFNCHPHPKDTVECHYTRQTTINFFTTKDQQQQQQQNPKDPTAVQKHVTTSGDEAACKEKAYS